MSNLVVSLLQLQKMLRARHNFRNLVGYSTMQIQTNQQLQIELENKEVDNPMHQTW